MPPLSRLAAAVPSADMTVRGLAGRLPKMEVLSRAPSTSNQHRVEPYRATEEPPTFARPPLRASMVVRALQRADGHRTCGSPAREADEQLERGHVSMRKIR